MDRLYQKSKSKVFERRIEFREMVDHTAQPSSHPLKKKITYNSSEDSSGNAEKQQGADRFSSADYLMWSQMMPIGPGFDNRGNTCFLNSVLQCIVYTPPLANYFLKINHHAQCHINGFCAACALSDLIRKCLSPNNRQNNSSQMMHRSITPALFVSRLHAIAKTMRLGRQEDSHEFLRFLVDAVSRGFNKNTSTSGKLNPVTAIFEFNLQSTVACLSCKRQSHAKDPAMDLMLDIKGCNSVDKALALFSKKDMLTGRNRYKCEHCKKLCDASKQMFVASPPNVLCMQLKRFEFTSFGQRKISNFVSYPETLDLPYHTGDKVHHKKYDLYGVLVHSGHTSRSGHYYSFVKAPNEIWYCMDDSSVSQTKKAKILQQNAYILFYVAKPELVNKTEVASSTPKHVHAANSVPPSPPTSPSLHNKPVTNIHKAHSQVLSSKIQQAQSKLSQEVAADPDNQKQDAYPTPPVSQKEIKKGPTTISMDDIFSSAKKKKKNKEKTASDKPVETAAKEVAKNEKAQDAILMKLGIAIESIKETKKRRHDDIDDDEEKEKIKPPAIQPNLTRIPDHKIINHADQSGLDLERIVGEQDIIAKPQKSKSKRPKNYDIDYDEGKQKKRRTKKAWSVFDLPNDKPVNNPFTHAQNRMNKSKH